MPFAVVGGVTMQVTAMQRDSIEVGDFARASDGTHLADIETEKLVYEIEATFDDLTDAETWDAAVASRTEVTCTGDAFGTESPLTAVVTSRRYPYVRTGETFALDVRFRLEQV